MALNATDMTHMVKVIGGGSMKNGLMKLLNSARKNVVLAKMLKKSRIWNVILFFIALVEGSCLMFVSWKNHKLKNPEKDIVAKLSDVQIIEMAMDSLEKISEEELTGTFEQAISEEELANKS